MKEKVKPLSLAYVRERTRSYAVMGAVSYVCAMVYFVLLIPAVQGVYSSVAQMLPADLFLMYGSLVAFFGIMTCQFFGAWFHCKGRKEAIAENAVILRAIQDLQEKRDSQPSAAPYGGQAADGKR